MASDGLTRQRPPNAGFWRYDGNTGAKVGAGWNALSAGATQFDWSPDDSAIVFVVPNFQYDAHFGDDHFAAGALYTISYAPASDAFGTPTALVPQQGAENNYYPSYSPDGRLIVFNRADRPAVGVSTASTNGVDAGVDAYNNADARVFVMAAAGGTPVELATLDLAPGLTNSWPRWSPFVQSYQGQKLLWVTFSSTRDYGLQVQNQNQGLSNCYPPDTPENPCSANTGGLSCHKVPLAQTCNQPQIWMAAVYADPSALAKDPSFPAFWLPVQDLTSHNHSAQWTAGIAEYVDGGCVIFEGSSSCGGVGIGDGGGDGGVPFF